MISVRVTYTAKDYSSGRVVPGFQTGTVLINERFVNAEPNTPEYNAYPDIVMAAIENKYNCEVITLTYPFIDGVETTEK